MSEPAEGPGTPLLGRYRTAPRDGYRRLIGAHRALGVGAPSRGYLFTVALLAGTASMPILAAFSAGSATIGNSALPDSGTPFIPTPSVGPVVVALPSASQPAVGATRTPGAGPATTTRPAVPLILAAPALPNDSDLGSAWRPRPAVSPSPPAPGPTRTPPTTTTSSPSASGPATPDPTPTATAEPTSTVSGPTGDPSATASPSGSPEPTPTASPGASPPPTSPAPTESPAPSLSPTPDPGPSPTAPGVYHRSGASHQRPSHLLEGRPLPAPAPRPRPPAVPVAVPSPSPQPAAVPDDPDRTPGTDAARA